MWMFLNVFCFRAASPPTEIDVPPDEPSKQPIVSFDEWTKEKLKQEQKKMVNDIQRHAMLLDSTSSNSPSTCCGPNTNKKLCI